MSMISRTDNRPYINVIFGNFCSPAYDDEAFIDETMELIRELGFNSVMFDTTCCIRERLPPSFLPVSQDSAHTLRRSGP